MSCLNTVIRLHDMLSEADTDTLLENIEKVLMSLDLTSGVWQAASYAYKGLEIAQRCRNICDDADRDWCMNWKRRERVSKLKMEAWRLQEVFHKLQQEHFYGPSNESLAC